MITESNKDNFMSELMKLMLRHNISIAHEDTQGAFIIRQFNRSDALWMLSASLKGDENE
ncbi:hypothetical protein Barba10S_gp009 [Rheinheimera phage vB_RspM_Barba10S]|uniref:Uncharacterized protein n=1 Tax=Rheinheimera phage vB_RspM_Barba10S TaxID=2565645 RepID=A0A4V1EZF9_9CAUD|nr:hypothetical protein Barba10S_gp009 [Rheinheimera phage vB_RspM_Barba10S]